MNSLTVAGNISSAPTTRGDSTIFRVTVPYKEGIENTLTFTAFRTLAENIKSLEVGDRVIIKGHIETSGFVADDVGLSFRDADPFEDAQ